MPFKPFPTTAPKDAKKFTDARAAIAHVRELYETNTAFLRERFQLLASGRPPLVHSSACYPYVAITTTRPTKIDTRLSFGFVPEPGRYSSTLTRPDLFEHYYLEQFAQLLKNHQVPLEVGVSAVPIPIHFAYHDDMHVEGGLAPENVELMRENFDVPKLAVTDDSIANCTFQPVAGADAPLALFTAPRTDYSLHRLRHYTGTDPRYFQNFVIFTNYQFYVDEFVRMGLELMDKALDPEEAARR